MNTPAKDHHERQRFLVEFEAAGDHVTTHSFKLLLKTALRRFGYRAVTIRQLEGE